MRKFAITTDLAADMPEGFFSGHGVDVIPMPFSVDGNEYFDEGLPSFPNSTAKCAAARPQTLRRLPLMPPYTLSRDISRQAKTSCTSRFLRG